MSNAIKVGTTIQKAVIEGAVAGFGLKVLTNANTKNFIYNGRAIPVWQVGFGLGASASIIVQLVSRYVLPHIPGNKKMAHLESLSLHIALSSAIFYGVPYYMNNRLTADEGAKFVLAGIASETISSLISDTFLEVEGLNQAEYGYNQNAW